MIIKFNTVTKKKSTSSKSVNTKSVFCQKADHATTQQNVFV